MCRPKIGEKFLYYCPIFSKEIIRKNLTQTTRWTVHGIRDYVLTGLATGNDSGIGRWYVRLRSTRNQFQRGLKTLHEGTLHEGQRDACWSNNRGGRGSYLVQVRVIGVSWFPSNIAINQKSTIIRVVTMQTERIMWFWWFRDLRAGY